MKRLIVFATLMLTAMTLTAQQVYWVFLTDKQGSSFDPYTYFDAKAIERYRACGADLYDASNYPLVQRYVDGVEAIATESLGGSRWMNALGVVATAEQVEAIERLPYVARVQPIGGDMQLAKAEWRTESEEIASPQASLAALADSTLNAQLLRMQGHLFRQAGIDGRGVRIAVFDGGFPRVNTHEAFRHLRDNHQILKTWNFPNRKEDVYGWNSHGTMTLSCIAGRMKGKDIGLATGAEFMLARTEVEPEPFKEEVWWMQAVEWADKGGANIISSSLGYGKDRYYTRDMNGRSYVARAANMAARKGILVVNSAGNEGDDATWRYIITPSDADSALCVGGITYSLKDYEHIDFASYGPSADGRQKPDVCAFAHAWAASPKNDQAYEMVFGTSFSCPLVAGFAACAWQASKGKTAMEMFDLIRRSADLYPYCDYAFGYGVPQAGFFVNNQGNTEARKEPLFRLEELSPTSVSLVFLRPDSNVHVFYKDLNADGTIALYGKRTFPVVDSSVSIDFRGGRQLVVFCGGQTAEHRFAEPTAVADKADWTAVHSSRAGVAVGVSNQLLRMPSAEAARERRGSWGGYAMLGVPVSLTGDELSARFWSPAKRFGVHWRYRIAKAYSLGVALEYGHVTYRYNDRSVNALEYRSYVDAAITHADKVSRRRLNVGTWSAELFQRVRLLPAGMFHNGLHWDLGAYVSYMPSNDYQLTYRHFDDAVADTRRLTLDRLNSMEVYRWQWGVSTRLTYDFVGLYARYRLSNVPDGELQLPRLEVGMLIQF